MRTRRTAAAAVRRDSRSYAGDARTSGRSAPRRPAYYPVGPGTGPSYVGRGVVPREGRPAKAWVRGGWGGWDF